MDKFEASKFRNYPEGSGGKKNYDKYFLDFQEYLNNYFKYPDLSRWHYINMKFVNPLFDGSDWESYMLFLYQVKPSFFPDREKKQIFWSQINNDDRFSLDIKYFFTFLYTINFCRNLSFEEWINIKNWEHPWYEDEMKEAKSIIELLKYNYSENYLKVHLAILNIF